MSEQRPQPGPYSASEALVIGTRWRKVALFIAAAMVAVVVVVGIRRDPDLELEDWLWSALILFLAAWVAAQGLGLVARRLVAGHALRLDASGIHYPGWDVVPWSAVKTLQVMDKMPNSGKGNALVIELDLACRAAQRGSYERWAFGPIEGLVPGKPLHIGLASMDIDPKVLRAACEAWKSRHR